MAFIKRLTKIPIKEKLSFIATSYQTMGVTKYYSKEYDKAIKYHKDSYDIKKQIYADDPMNEKIGISANYMGGTLLKLGEAEKSDRNPLYKERYKEAMSYFEEALPILKKLGDSYQIQNVTDNMEEAKREIQ